MAKSRNTIEREEAQYACFGSKYELYNVLLRASWPENSRSRLRNMDRIYETRFRGCSCRVKVFTKCSANSVGFCWDSGVQEVGFLNLLGLMGSGKMTPLRKRLFFQIREKKFGGVCERGEQCARAQSRHQKMLSARLGAGGQSPRDPFWEHTHRSAMQISPQKFHTCTTRQFQKRVRTQER